MIAEIWERINQNAYWETFFKSIEQLLELANNLKKPTSKRLTIDLLQLRSFITPLEYTSRPFTLVPIKYWPLKEGLSNKLDLFFKQNY